MHCTVFSVRESDLSGDGGEQTLPGYDELSGRKSSLGSLHTLELGITWKAMHRTLGEHGAEHPLGFLAAGGQPVPALDEGGQSSGRFFPPPLVVQILAAVAQIVQPPKDLERLRVFLAEAVAADRGIVVHQFA